MQDSEAHHWLKQGERRQRILSALNQPMTARQLSSRTGMGLDSCSRAIWELRAYSLVQCLNRPARRSRLYWLTPRGKACQRKLFQARSLRCPDHEFPRVDWDLYGWVCYTHRSAVIKVLTAPLQPAEIKRRARSQNSELKMSANNVRDIIRVFLEKGIVRPVKTKSEIHNRYELTEIGKELRVLLLAAETRP